MSSSLQDSGTRTIQLVAGSSTTTFQSPNIFTLTLPSTGIRLGRDEIALKSLSLYYSWANISSQLGNNSLSYIFPGVATPYTVVFADGIWSFADVEAYLQQIMVQNGHYLLDQYGNQVFYMSLLTNPVLYCISLTCTPVPTTLPTGYSNPTGLNLAAAGGHTPQLQIPATAVTTLTGFAAGSYPAAPQTTIFNANSGIPQITNTTSLNVICSIVDNRGFSLIPNILTSFSMPNGQVPGSLIQYSPYSLDWIPTQQQISPTQISISIVNQLGVPIVIRDPSGVVITLNIRRRAL